MMSVCREDVLGFYCLTVEMMSVCEIMCSISIVQLLKWCLSVWEDVLNFYCPTVEMMSVFDKMCSISIVLTVEMMSVFENMC